MWADVDRLMYEFQAKGRGEYLFEDPIFFGTAFGSPPTLSYSSITDGSGPPVIPFRTVPPRLYRKNIDSNHLGNHSMGTNNTILDPGFEVQGQFIPLLGDDARYIPVTSDSPKSWEYFDNDIPLGEWPEAREPRYIGPPGEYDFWNHWPSTVFAAWHKGGYEPAPNLYGDREPLDGTNSWIQTGETEGRWAITNEKSHDYGVGAKGEYSAKYTFVEDGSSNWMIPLGWMSGWPEWLSFDYPDKAHWGFFSLQSWGDNSYGGATAIPPILPGWEGTAAVWSDEDCEFEAWNYNWWDTEGFEGSEPMEYGFWDERYWDYIPMPMSYDDPTPMHDSDAWFDYWSDRYDPPRWVEQSRTWITCHMGSSETVKVPIVGGKWNDVSYYLPRGKNQWQLPNHPPGHPLNLSGPGWQQETFRFRINNGSPGQVVYLDNVYVWPDIRNIYVPMVTIGVAEWVVDEQGAYIGAKLWIKVGEPSDDGRG